MFYSLSWSWVQASATLTASSLHAERFLGLQWEDCTVMRRPRPWKIAQKQQGKVEIAPASGNG